MNIIWIARKISNSKKNRHLKKPSVIPWYKSEFPVFNFVFYLEFLKKNYVFWFSVIIEFFSILMLFLSSLVIFPLFCAMFISGFVQFWKKLTRVLEVLDASLELSKYYSFEFTRKRFRKHKKIYLINVNNVQIKKSYINLHVNISILIVKNLLWL